MDHLILILKIVIHIVESLNQKQKSNVGIEIFALGNLHDAFL